VCISVYFFLVVQLYPIGMGYTAYVIALMRYDICLVWFRHLNQFILCLPKPYSKKSIHYLERILKKYQCVYVLVRS